MVRNHLSKISRLGGAACRRAGTTPVLLAGLLAVAALPQASAQSADSGDMIWIGLVRCDFEPPTTHETLKKMEPRLNSVFGYSSYHLLHETSVPTGQNWEQWVMPRKDFYMKIVPMERTSQGDPKIHFEIYQDKKALVDGRFTINSERPVFINGPHCGKGKLVFVLKLAEAPTATASANPESR